MNEIGQGLSPRSPSRSVRGSTYHIATNDTVNIGSVQAIEPLDRRSKRLDIDSGHLWRHNAPTVAHFEWTRVPNGSRADGPESQPKLLLGKS